MERPLSPDARVLARVSVRTEQSALRLAAVNTPAARLGLQAGLTLADARARHPDLRVAAHDPSADARILDSLADACERYTPLLALDPPDGLILDISGCAHLFGGEDGLLRDLLGRVRAAGFHARAAIASAAAAAMALARSDGRGIIIVPEGQDLAARLAALPLDALRLEASCLALLGRLGFARIGDLHGAPRAPLAARFGAGLLERLDATTGVAGSALAYRQPPPRFMVDKTLAEPIARVEDVLGLVHHLAQGLADLLERQGMGARRLDLALFRVDGVLTRISVGAGRPVRDPAMVRRLFSEKVAACGVPDPGFGFDLLRLAAPLVQSMDPRQIGLDADREEEEALDALLDRLAARFGAAQILVPALADAHLPEQAGPLQPALGRSFAAPNACAPPAPQGDLAGPARPARLFATPEPVEALAEVPDGPPLRFRWRRVVHHVVRAEGPERLATPWWRTGGPALTRDYFRVETTDGARFWLFRAGLFGTEAAHPAWYVHGQFA